MKHLVRELAQFWGITISAIPYTVTCKANVKTIISSIWLYKNSYVGQTWSATP